MPIRGTPGDGRAGGHANIRLNEDALHDESHAHRSGALSRAWISNPSAFSRGMLFVLASFVFPSLFPFLSLPI